MLTNKKLILASKSPRRQMLLTEAGFDFDVKVIEIEETYPDDIEAMDVAQYIAEKKAKQVPFLKPNEILITADTTVVVEGEILGKPANKKEAAFMLRQISGKVHQVITGVCIKSKKKTLSFSDVTDVYFRTLTDDEIDYYIKEFKPMDKAGAYGIQEWIGMVGVTKIEGSYFNVMGLPIHKLYAELKSFED